MRRLVILLFLVGGCIGPVDAPVTQRQGAIGEPVNGFPSALERLGLMAINRARSDPETVAGPNSTSYPPRPPVIWSQVLNESSRFHANNLELADVTLMHTSPCTLNTNVATSGCAGDPSCACASAVPAMCASCAMVDATNTCGTAPFTRIGYFTSGSGVSATGEVAAAGYSDPMAVVDGWMDEAAGSDGHRMILTDQGTTANTMGYGHSTGANCWKTFDVGDSGNLKNAVIPKIPTAAVSPASGKAGAFTFYASWADPSLGSPSSLQVVIDGACTPLARELGTDTLNATYKVTATLAAGCHNYWISGTDAAGTAVTYPTTGSFNVSVGSVACSADYMTTATGSCLGDGGVTTGGSGTGGSGAPAGGASGSGSGGTGQSSGAGGQTGSGANAGGGRTGGGAGAGDTVGSSGNGGAGGDSVAGGCTCDVGKNDLPSVGAGLMLLALWLVSRRRAAGAARGSATRTTHGPGADRGATLS
jgi:hypothetical protein